MSANNGYIAILHNKRIEIYAKDMWEATQKAREEFKPKKKDKYLISVTLCELDGEQVVHTPDF